MKPLRFAVVLLAVAALVGLGWWLYRTEDPTDTSVVVPGRAGGVPEEPGLTGVAAPPAPSSEGEELQRAEDGAAIYTGTIQIVGGLDSADERKVQVVVTLIGRDGLALESHRIEVGEFTLTTSSPGTGRRLLAFEAAGHATVHQEVDALGGDVGRVTLLPTVCYRGRATFKDRADGQGAIIELLDSSGRVVGRSLPTGDDGRFEMSAPGLDALSTAVPFHQLRASVGGVVYAPVPASPEGLLGTHEVTFDDPRSVLIRFLDAATRTPFVGIRADWIPCSNGPRVGRVARLAVPSARHVTNEQGEIQPRWHRATRCACVRFMRGPDDTVWFLVEQSDVGTDGTLVLNVPRRCPVFEVRLGTRSDDRANGLRDTTVTLWKDQDADPEASWTIPIPDIVTADGVTSAGVQVAPSPLDLGSCDDRVQWVARTEFADGGVGFHEDVGTAERTPSGRILEVDPKPPAHGDHIAWISFEAPSHVPRPTPVFVSLAAGMQDGKQRTWVASFVRNRPVRGPDGRPRWAFRDLPPPGLVGVDAHTATRVWAVVRTSDGVTHFVAVRLDGWARAYRWETPLRVYLPPLEGTRVLEVSGASSGSVAHVITNMSSGDVSSVHSEVFPVDARGKVRIPAGEFPPPQSGVVVDPKTRATGAFSFEAGEVGRRVVVLRDPEPFRVQLEVPKDGKLIQWRCDLRTDPPSGLTVRCTYDPASGELLAASPVVAAHYRLFVMARVRSEESPQDLREYRWSGPAAGVAGGHLRLDESHRRR